MATADLFTLLREEVKCAICLDQLRKPRVLTCLHSFCEKCLETYKEEKFSAGKIACPVCDEETILTDAGILGLRQDFRAITLVERLEKEKPKQQQKTKVTKLCEVCGYIDSDLARSFLNCAECKHVLCRQCANRHKHLKLCTDASSTSPVVEAGLENNDDQEKRIFCEKHEGKKRDLFCTFCLIPVCNECSVSDHCPENNHNCVPVEDFVPVMREEIQSHLSNLAKVSEQCAGIIPKIKNAEDSAKKQRDLLDKQFDNDIDEYIHCMKTDLRVKNEKFYELRNQTLGQWRKIIEDRVESIVNIQVKAEEALEQSKNSSLIAAFYKDLLKSLHSLLSMAPEKYILKTINKVMEVRRLHFRLAEDKSLIGAQMYTKHDVCGRRTIYISTNDNDDDLQAMTFTRDGRLAVLASLGGPSYSQTTSSYVKEIGKGYSKIKQKLYEHCRYSAVKQTTMCSKVATKFDIDMRLPDDPGSALASLSDLRFVLDGEEFVSYASDVYNIGLYYVTNLPGPISDMATDLKDNIFCSVPSYHKIYVVRADGPQAKSIPTCDLTPQDIAVCPRSPDQIMFTHDSSKVSVIDWDGKLLSTIARPEWKDVAIGCDNDMLLYVLWKNEAGLRTLQRFYLNGELFDTLFEGETHSFSKLLLAVSPRGTAAVVTSKGMFGTVTIISATREFTGDETSLP